MCVLFYILSFVHWCGRFSDIFKYWLIIGKILAFVYDIITCDWLELLYDEQ